MSDNEATLPKVLANQRNLNPKIYEGLRPAIANPVMKYRYNPLPVTTPQLVAANNCRLPAG